MRHINLESQEIPLESLRFLPEILRESLKRSGITGLRDFQRKGIILGLENKNLVIVAPTGSGKTLIGEILAVINIIEGKKALFLVPYKALAEEMKNTLETRYPFIKVGISTGDYREKSIKRVGLERDLVILTYEKADLLRRDMPQWMNFVKIVIIDEVHLINDISRGSLLDSVITVFKMLDYQIIALSATIPNGDELACWLKAELVTSNYRPVKLLEGVYFPEDNGIYYYDPSPEEIELVTVDSIQGENNHETIKSISIQQAQLDNFIISEKKILEKQIRETLGQKIEIKSVHHKYVIPIKRRIIRNQLTEYIKSIMRKEIPYGDVIFEPIITPPLKTRGSIGPILDLVYDLLKKSRKYNTNWQILVFRRSRKLAQLTAQKIANFLNKLNLSKIYRNKTSEIIEKMLKISEPTPLTEELIELIRNGVAFHHAGLTYEERKIIEEAFRHRKISVIVATPTLGAGINVPARRVIIETLYYDPVFGYQQINVAQYKQRAGRAGRPGLDSIGEAILIAKNKSDLINLFSKYIFGSLELVRSKLGHNPSAIRQQLLALIASQKFVLRLDDIINFFKNTFFYWQCEKYSDYYSAKNLEKNIIENLEKLMEWGFVSMESSGYIATKIGKKISNLYIDPMSAHLILDALQSFSAKDKFDIDRLIIELLLLISATQDISSFRKRLLVNITKLSQFIIRLPDKILKLIEDVTSSHVMELIRLLSNDSYYEINANEEEKIASIGIVSMLLLWINGYHIQKILSNFSPNFGAGDFRELIRLFEWLLYCTKELARVIKIPPLVIKQIDLLRSRVQHGVTEDMLELVKIPGIGRARASILMKHGFKSINDLSRANVTILKNIPGIGERIAERIINYVKKIKH